MFPAVAYFSFAHVTEPSAHRAFNEYHQLDHMPENLALPAVAFGQRWVRSPDCASRAPAADPHLDPVHYVTMYWLRHPTEASRREWLELGTRARFWGRRPDLGLVRRPLIGAFSPVRGTAHPRVKVSAHVLPLRPMRGVHVRVSDLVGDELSVERACRWHEDVRVPGLLEVPGVAGIWSFVSESSFPASTGVRAGQAPPNEGAPPVRIEVAFLDADPVEVFDEIVEREAASGGQGLPDGVPEAEHLRFSSPLRTITPWEWDWFD